MSQGHILMEMLAAAQNADPVQLKLKLMSELVILQADLAVLGANMAREDGRWADRVMDCSTTAGRIWEMLR